MPTVKAPDNRSVHASSTAGCTIHLNPGESRKVPEFMIPLMYAAGAVPASEDAPPPPEPMTAEERQSAVNAAVAALFETGEKKDFTANNLPRHKSVEAITGFDVTSDEINEAVRILAETGSA